MSVFGVILVRIFPHLDWIRRDTLDLSVFNPNAGNYRLEFSPYGSVDQVAALHVRLAFAVILDKSSSLASSKLKHLKVLPFSSKTSKSANDMVTCQYVTTKCIVKYNHFWQNLHCHMINGVLQLNQPFLINFFHQGLIVKFKFQAPKKLETADLQYHHLIWVYVSTIQAHRLSFKTTH